MFVDFDDELLPPRQRPWTVTVTTTGGQYWDFRTHSEKIRTSLEDEIPWQHYDAVAVFYDLLEWVNGEDSISESNDCGLRQPVVDPTTPDLVPHVFDQDPIVIHGPLTILFRNDC